MKRLFLILTIIIVAILLTASNFIQTVPESTEAIVALITVAFGLVGMTVVQGIKWVYKRISGSVLEDNKALSIAVLIAIGLGLVIVIPGLFVGEGEPLTIVSVSEAASMVFAVATILFKVFVSGKK